MTRIQMHRTRSGNLVVLPLAGPRSSRGWVSQSACQREDPELFFPAMAAGAAARQVSEAKAICCRCVVRASCLSYALMTAQDGIWGGTTPEERRAMRWQPGPHADEQPDGARAVAVVAVPGVTGARAARHLLAMPAGTAS
jgi:WhiB family transcriptional regulator, redox-sensing transcriptional regulator